jgi:hypothetical protein
MLGFNSVVVIVFIGLAILFSGCTNDPDVTPIVKSIPEVQQLIKEHPNANIIITYWSKEEVAESIQAINKQCDKPMTPLAMYKAIVSDGDLKVISWINAENRILICYITEGKGFLPTPVQSTQTPNSSLTVTPIVTSAITPIATSTPTVIPTPYIIVPEVTPTGTRIKLDSIRGFIPNILTIKTFDEVVWDNFDTVTVKLVSNDGLFNAKSLTYNQQYRYIFDKTGTYTFSLENTGLDSTVIVESQGIPTPVPSITLPKETLSTALYVTARMKPMIDWTSGNEIKYELNSLKVHILNQQNDPLSIKTQILSYDRILEEKSFVLENLGNTVEFLNERKHFVNSTNVSLRILANGYPPIEYPFIVVDQLN